MYGDIFEGMNLKGEVAYCAGRLTLAIGQGNFHGELIQLLMFHAAWHYQRGVTDGRKDLMKEIKDAGGIVTSVEEVVNATPNA